MGVRKKINLAVVCWKIWCKESSWKT